MVQVDVFWSYGIGAGIAFANARQLRHARFTRANEQSVGYAEAVTFLGAVFAPSGLLLLTAFPSWETMHVASQFGDLPPWLVAAFALTNLTQGILGYKVTEYLVHRGSEYLAFLQWMLGYFAMFFVLVHGWDGTGYQRFFSTDGMLVGWNWYTAAAWLVSDVAVTLYAMGVVLVPWLLVLMARPLVQGYQAADEVHPGAADRSLLGVALRILGLNTVVLIGVAVLASLLVRGLGWGLGTVAFAATAYALLLRPGAGLLHAFYRHLLFAEPLLQRPRGLATATLRG